MKKLFYSIGIGSLALAISAVAADNDKLVRQGKAQKASTTRAASVKAGNTARTNVHRSSNVARFQAQSLKSTHNNTTTLQQNRFRDHSAAVSRQRNFDGASVRHNTVTNAGRNLSVNRAKNVTTVDRSRNFNAHTRNLEVNRERNTTLNRRNVTVNNNWRGTRFNGTNYAAFRNYHREWHDRSWWRNHHTRIIFVSGGWYYWNTGFWYPAWGYDSGYAYPYDGPIYGYNGLAPDQVVVNVQAQLQRDGYYSGPVDGILGPMTRQAIADFQADHGLAITSAVDQPTLATLGLV